VPTNCLRLTSLFGIYETPFLTGAPHEGMDHWQVVEHWWHEDRLWLDTRYSVNSLRYSETGSGWVTAHCGAAVVLDPDTGVWDTILYPPSDAIASVRHPSSPGDFGPPPGFESSPQGGTGAPFNGEFYLSTWNSLMIYGVKGRQWRTLPAPWQIPTSLRVIGSRLIALNNEAIFEIEGAGRTFKTLASVRRKPPVTKLDSVTGLGADLSQGGFGGKMNEFLLSDLLRCDLTWLLVTPKSLLIGQDDLRGVWALPSGELDAAIAGEKAREASSETNPNGTDKN